MEVDQTIDEYFKSYEDIEVSGKVVILQHWKK